MKKAVIAIVIAAVMVFYFDEINGFFNSGSSSDEIEIYIANGCPPCDEAVAFLNEYGLDHVAYNISESDEDRKRFQKLHTNNFPLVKYGKEKLAGYSEQLYLEFFSPWLVDINDITPDPEIRVVLFSTERCGYCKAVKAYLQEKDVLFHEYDIEKDPVGLAKFEKYKGGGVPLLFVGDFRIYGFNRDRIKKGLKREDLI